MPNFVQSQVTIEPQEAKDYIFSLLEETESGVDLLKKFYDVDQTQLDSDDWWYNNVGTSTINLKKSDVLEIDTTGWFPDGFLLAMYFKFCNQFDNLKIHCKWKDDVSTQCGVAIIQYGFFAEEDSLLVSDSLEDDWYVATGEELIYDVQSWLLRYADQSGDVTKWEVQIMEDDQIRKMFAQTKDKIRNEGVMRMWEDLTEYCQDAIYTEDPEYVSSRLVKLANKNYSKIEGVYPFK